MPEQRKPHAGESYDKISDKDAGGARGQESFWSVWADHWEYLLGLSLRWMGGNYADAEDALSLVKIKAVLHFGGGPAAIRNERAWLRRLLRNVCVDAYRRRGNARESVYLDFENRIEAPPEARSELSPEDSLLKRELFREIEGLLADLPQDWRNAFIARLIRDRSYGEIAAAEGTTEANIRKRVQLARQKLRDRLSRTRHNGW